MGYSIKYHTADINLDPCKDVILHNLGRSLRLAPFHVGSVNIVNV